MSIELAEALYYFCEDYHSGQWSRGYRILCRVSRIFKPGILHSMSEEAEPIYHELVAKYADKV
jgi:hypothetical protein